MGRWPRWRTDDDGEWDVTWHVTGLTVAQAEAHLERMDFPGGRHRSDGRTLSYVVMLAVGEFLTNHPDGKLSGNAADRTALAGFGQTVASPASSCLALGAAQCHRRWAHPPPAMTRYAPWGPVYLRSLK